MEELEKMEKLLFLGHEFILWILYRSENQKGFLAEEKDDSIELWCSKKIVFSDSVQGYESLSVAADEPITTEEAKTALRMGKIVKELHLSLIHKESEWSFTLNPKLEIKGLKVNSFFNKNEPELLIDRVAQLEDVFYLFKEIFKYFIKLRIDEDRWAKEDASIKQWIFGS